MKFTKIKCIGLCCVSGVLLASYLPKTIVSADAIGGKLTVGTSTLTANTKNNTVAESLTSSDKGDSKVLYVQNQDNELAVIRLTDKDDVEATVKNVKVAYQTKLDEEARIKKQAEDEAKRVQDEEAEKKRLADEEAKVKLEAEQKEQQRQEQAKSVETQSVNQRSIVQQPVLTNPVSSGSSSIVSSSSLTHHLSSGNAYPVGQCTWGVKELAPWAGTFWGNAASWTYSAAAEGFSTGTTPTVGAIAVWSGGHVAYVTAVESESNIQVMESNYAGIQGIGNYRGWFNPIGAQGSVTYIYPPSGL